MSFEQIVVSLVLLQKFEINHATKLIVSLFNLDISDISNIRKNYHLIDGEAPAYLEREFDGDIPHVFFIDGDIRVDLIEFMPKCEKRVRIKISKILCQRRWLVIQVRPRIKK